MLCRPCFLSIRLRRLYHINTTTTPAIHSTHTYVSPQPTTRGLLRINCPLIYLPMSPIRIRIRFCHTLCLYFRPSLFDLLCDSSTASLNLELFFILWLLYPLCCFFLFSSALPHSVFNTHRPSAYSTPPYCPYEKGKVSSLIRYLISYPILYYPTPISISILCATSFPRIRPWPLS